VSLSNKILQCNVNSLWVKVSAKCIKAIFNKFAVDYRPINSRNVNDMYYTNKYVLGFDFNQATYELT